MGGLAQLCRQKGWIVSGSDQQVYPPMSDQLAQAGITLHEGYDPAVLKADLDLVVVGNSMSRGNLVVEEVLDRRIPFISGPELLGRLTGEMVVLAVAGTHGKTTTASMLAWILECQRLNPGFLIGGVPQNFDVSARLGGGKYFIVEADEYDTAFFDKRSKFVHYHADIFGINNLEFDHADIFDTITSIEMQFHFAIRRVPRSGLIVARSRIKAIDRVLERGCWSKQMWIGRGTTVEFESQLNELFFPSLGQCIEWNMRGAHNARNAELAVAMACSLNVPIEVAFSSLQSFRGVARRLNLMFEGDGLKIWDDFAHHPTAIEATLSALAEDEIAGPLTAVIELRSNTMKLGIHGDALLKSVDAADIVYWVLPESQDWNVSSLIRRDGTAHLVADALCLPPDLVSQLRGQIVFMSNGGFSKIQQRVVEAIKTR